MAKDESLGACAQAAAGSGPACACPVHCTAPGHSRTQTLPSPLPPGCACVLATLSRSPARQPRRRVRMPRLPACEQSCSRARAGPAACASAPRSPLPMPCSPNPSSPSVFPLQTPAAARHALYALKGLAGERCVGTSTYQLQMLTLPHVKQSARFGH